jgi:hypothetical protein
MPTECSAARFDFASLGKRQVVGDFGGGAITSDAGALLLGQTDRALGLTERFAGCFLRCPELIEHAVKTLVGQRVFGIALGYEDLSDHDELRHDPVMAVLAGKATLNRLELSRADPTRYKKIAHDGAAIEALFVDLLLSSFIAKAEWTQGEANPRFIVTSLTDEDGDGRKLYEDIYCARGEMENRIKECQLDLFADRTSTATMAANQLRLWFASMAYVLVESTRRIALATTELANATCGTIRLKLFKIGALVTVSVRRVKFAFASGCPVKAVFAIAHRALANAADTS